MFVARTMLRGGVVTVVLTLGACGVVVDIDDAPPDGGGVEGGAADSPATRESGDDGPVVVADGGADADADADAQAPCTDDMPFLLPVEPITDLGIVTGARFVADGKYAFVSGHGAASFTGDQIYEGPFPKTADPYVPVIDSDDDDSHPAPTPDRMRVYYEIDGGSGRAVATATRSAPSGVFGAPSVLPIGFGPGVQTREPYAIAGGSVIYFTRQPGTAGLRDIYRAEDAGAGTWNVTIVAGNVSTGQDEGFPVVSEDELTIYFTRGPGAGDIFVAKRANKTALFAASDPVPGINDPASEDRPTWLSPDRCTLFFTSNRSTTYALYRARRR